MRRLMRRLLNAFEWACIRAIEEWFDTFARAWRTGSGLPAAPASRPALCEPRERVRAVCAPVAARAGEAVGGGIRIAQPSMDERAIVAGLRNLGFKDRDASARAAQKALAGGPCDASEMMRRALGAVRS